MANGYDDEKQFPFPLVKKGKGYERAIQSRSQSILNSLQNLLASNYQATIPSTEYATFLRSMSIELAKFTVALEQLQGDISFDDVRSEFLYQSFGYILFLNDQLPDLEFSDEEFREFLLKIVEIYFQGATPESIKEAVELFTDESFSVEERFQDLNADISEQFGFSIEFDLNNAFPQDFFKVQSNIQLLVDIIKPAHTLFRIRNIFKDSYDTADEVSDSVEWQLDNYYYDDVRKYCQGMSGFSSQTGEIVAGSLEWLEETDTTKPLYSVQPTAELVVLTGPNKGFYSVVKSETNKIRVVPAFVEVESGVDYKVEVDRLGYKEEKQVVSEDVSSQFLPQTKSASCSMDVTASLNASGEEPDTFFGETQLSGTSTISLTGEVA